MTLASGADVKIGSYEFRLDESVDAGSRAMSLYRPHYRYSAQSLFRPRLDVQTSNSTPAKSQLRPERLVWFFDDWTGGENGRTYYSDDPSLYDYSLGLNPRIRGQLTGRPDRSVISVGTAAHSNSPALLSLGNGALWVAGGGDLFYSTAATPSFTQVTSNTNTDGTDLVGILSQDSASRITAVTGDANYLYYSSWSSTASGTRVLMAKTADNSVEAQNVQSGALTAVAPFAGLALMNGNLYAWTGANLWKYNISNPFPLTQPDAYQKWRVAINHLSGTDHFKLTCNSNSTAELDRQTNVSAASVQSAIRSAWDSNWTLATVTGPGSQSPGTTHPVVYEITASTLGDLSSTPVTVTATSGCTGKVSELRRGNTQNQGNADVSVVGTVGQDPSSSQVLNGSTPSTAYFADCVAAETSVFCFMTAGGRSTVYEYDDNAGFAPVFHAPIGFSVKSIRYQSGVLYINGHWGDDTNVGAGAVYGYVLNNRAAQPVGFIRKQNGLTLKMDLAAASYGNQTLMADKGTGRIFVYDADFDAFSMLDVVESDLSAEGSCAGTTSQPTSLVTSGTLTFTSGYKLGGMLTLGASRFATIYPASGSDTSGAYQLVVYKNDEPTNRQVASASIDSSTSLIIGQWDYDLPFDKKTLLGFDVTYDPASIVGLNAGTLISVEYDTDNSITGTSWTSAGTITGSTASATGRSYIALGSPATFTNLRVRVTLTGSHSGAPDKPPILLGLAAEAELLTYEETWDLIVRVKDALEREKLGKDSMMSRGATVRDYLRTLVTNKTVVTFLDGYRYRFPGKYTTHTVMIDSIEDVIINDAEGDIMMTLRAVPA